MNGGENGVMSTVFNDKNDASKVVYTAMRWILDAGTIAGRHGRRVSPTGRSGWTCGQLRNENHFFLSDFTSKKRDM